MTEDIWNVYQSRLDAHGATVREAIEKREVRMLNSKLPNTLSYELVDIYLSEYGFNILSEETRDHKITQNVAVINSDNLNEKLIYSMPGEDIEIGSLVVLDDSYWLVCEKDYGVVLYTKAKIIQCNYLLKWIQDGEIMAQWCIIEDGTKYMTGELEDRNFVVTRGDARIAMQIARNEHTVKFNRECRFLIDDEDSPHKMSFMLTKPLKVGSPYNGKGVFKFVLQESTATGDDNHELGIADYYKYFTKDGTKISTSGENKASDDETLSDDTLNETNGKRVWF